MALLTPVGGADCKRCGASKLKRETKEEASGLKVYGRCTACEANFGRVGFVAFGDFDHKDEAHEQADELVAQRAAI